jgi:CHAT domain-containing protein
MKHSDIVWRLIVKQTDAALFRGYAAASEGRFDEAIDSLFGAMRSFCKLAGIHVKGEEFADAETVARAFNSFESLNIRQALAMAVSKVAETMSDAGVPQGAVAWASLADGMHGTFGDAGRLRRAANAVVHGKALHALHDFEQAERVYECAATYLPPNAPKEARFAVTIASAVLGRSTQRREQSVSLLRGLAREIDSECSSKMVGWVFANLAMIDDFPEGRIPQAIAHLKRAHECLARPDGDPSRLAEVEQSLALTMWLAGDVGAFKFAVSALARNAARPNPDVGWRTMESLANILWRAEHFDFAVTLLKITMDVLQLLRVARSGFDEVLLDLSVEGPAFVYDRLAMLLTEQGRFGETREVLALKYSVVSGASDPIPPPITEDEEWAIRELYEGLGRQARRFSPEELGRTVEHVASELARRSAASAAVIETLNVQILEKARNSMPPTSRRDTLVLSCMQDATQVRILAETDGAPISLGCQKPVESTKVNKLIREFVDALISGRPGVRERLGRELTEILLAPILSRAPSTVRRLMICAPGPLHGLPWAALPWRDGYLIEYFDLVRASGPDIDLQRCPVVPMRILAGGCSAAGAEALPRAAVEVNALGADWILDHPLAFTANGIRNRLKDASVLHLATHFSPEFGRLAESRLTLGDGSSLSLRELLGLGLSNLDLLVLSTCDSGVAGGINDARAFAVDHILNAGNVPAVIGMLFRVNDAAMARFMERFYKRLRLGDDKARALAAVQGAFLNGEEGTDWRSPFFWAAPVLSGNWLGWPAP